MNRQVAQASKTVKLGVQGYVRNCYVFLCPNNPAGPAGLGGLSLPLDVPVLVWSLCSESSLALALVCITGMLTHRLFPGSRLRWFWLGLASEAQWQQTRASGRMMKRPAFPSLCLCLGQSPAVTSTFPGCGSSKFLLSNLILCFQENHVHLLPAFALNPPRGFSATLNWFAALNSLRCQYFLSVFGWMLTNIVSCFRMGTGSAAELCFGGREVEWGGRMAH